MSDDAARALYGAWLGLLPEAAAQPSSGWAGSCDAVEAELTRENVLRALPRHARAHVELAAEVARCERCRCRLITQQERFSRLCPDCENELLMDVEYEAVDEW